MRRMRRLSQAIDEIKKEDPNTALTLWHLRQMIASGELPCHRAGRTMLIDIDLLSDVLEGKPLQEKAPEVSPFSLNHVRRVSEARR